MSDIFVVFLLLSQIGTQFLRGVSGGERKRTAVGMELIIQPPVLFLDEPTTGLDARTATSVLQILHRQVIFYSYISLCESLRSFLPLICNIIAS